MEVEDEEKKQWISLLKSVKFFDGLGDEDLERFLTAGEIIHYPTHEYIVKEGEVDSSFFVILKGSAKLLKKKENNQKQELWTLAAGDCIGEIGILLHHDRTASVLSTQECYIFKMSADAIETMPEATQKKLYKTFAVLLAEKLRSTTEYLVSPYFV